MSCYCMFDVLVILDNITTYRCSTYCTSTYCTRNTFYCVRKTRIMMMIDDDTVVLYVAVTIEDTMTQLLTYPILNSIP